MSSGEVAPADLALSASAACSSARALGIGCKRSAYDWAVKTCDRSTAVPVDACAAPAAATADIAPIRLAIFLSIHHLHRAFYVYMSGVDLQDAAMIDALRSGGRRPRAIQQIHCSTAPTTTSPGHNG